MKKPPCSQDEFNTLFAGKVTSQEQLQREYEAFLALIEQLEAAPVPELSTGEKASIFRRAWQPPAPERSWVWAWLSLLRQPAVTFALGLAFGCGAMFVGTRNPLDTSEPMAPGLPLTVERTATTQTYAGKLLQGLYPQIENPKLVVERTQEAETPQRTLHGTLDDGEIYIVWNL